MNGCIDDYRWLVSDAAAPWLERVAAEVGPLAAQIQRLRRELSAERTHLVLEQVELRRRAGAKFLDAPRLFFARKGLEQATDQWVAAYKAARFAGGAPTADLCCGIGGDLLALAQRGPAVAWERDPMIAVLAEANLQALRLPGQVIVGDVAEFLPSEDAGWHIDPDRRPAGRRTTHLEWHAPPVEVVQRHLDRGDIAAIKLSPAAQLPTGWAERAELEWIGRDRQCRQLVAWFGPLATVPGHRRATILDDSPSVATLVRTLTGDAAVRVPRAERIGRYVFDPDPAVCAAGLVGSLAAEHGLAAWDSETAYLTGDRAIADAALGCFEVSDVLPFDLKRLKRHMAQRGVGQLEIKKRGVAMEPEQLRQQLRLRGNDAAVLLIGPVAGTVKAVVARRLGDGLR